MNYDLPDEEPPIDYTPGYEFLEPEEETPESTLVESTIQKYATLPSTGTSYVLSYLILNTGNPYTINYQLFNSQVTGQTVYSLPSYSQRTFPFLGGENVMSTSGPIESLPIPMPYYINSITGGDYIRDLKLVNLPDSGHNLYLVPQPNRSDIPSGQYYDLTLSSLINDNNYLYIQILCNLTVTSMLPSNTYTFTFPKLFVYGNSSNSLFACDEATAEELSSPELYTWNFTDPNTGATLPYATYTPYKVFND